MQTVIVTGSSGLIGSETAKHFARAGLRVALVERDTFGSGATAAGMGHIVVLDDAGEQARTALRKLDELSERVQQNRQTAGPESE